MATIKLIKRPIIQPSSQLRTLTQQSDDISVQLEREEQDKAQKQRDLEVARTKRQLEALQKEREDMRSQLQRKTLEMELGRYKERVSPKAYNTFVSLVSNQLQVDGDKIQVKDRPDVEPSSFIDTFLTENDYLCSPTIQSGTGAKPTNQAVGNPVQADIGSWDGINQALRTKFSMGGR